MKSSTGKIKGYGLVRIDGKPVFDNVDNIPGPIWDMLTDEEKEVINRVRNSQHQHPKRDS